jgi:thymidylate synthase ThyX
MSINAVVIADSISPQGIRLTTMQTRYPKFCHGEVMTHRVFSRNASSSRAIPVERLIQDIIDDPAIPSFSGVNKPGMQAGEPLTEDEREYLISEWLQGRDEAVARARRMAERRGAKQDINRLIEPWVHINTLISSTEWANFYALRRHPDAQPEIKALADAMYTAQQASTPRLLLPGEWHLPYATEMLTRSDPTIPIKLSVARCARVSYLTHDMREPNIEEDLRLYDRLVGSVPLHASPAEHQATPDSVYIDWANPREHGNFVGWRQYRHMLPNESIKDR